MKYWLLGSEVLAIGWSLSASRWVNSGLKMLNEEIWIVLEQKTSCEDKTVAVAEVLSFWWTPSLRLLNNSCVVYFLNAKYLLGICSRSFSHFTICSFFHLGHNFNNIICGLSILLLTLGLNCCPRLWSTCMAGSFVQSSPFTWKYPLKLHFFFWEKLGPNIKSKIWSNI